MADLKPSIPSGLYVDVENLQGGAKDLLISLLGDWPHAIPRPTKVVLYVRADMVELWRMWALTHINEQAVEVNGIQHFAAQQSKNSADIAIAIEAICDLLNGLVNHVAVFSDDSDFISLFSKVRTETKEIQAVLGRIPFLWILTDRTGTKTPNIRQFFPDDYLHIVWDSTQSSTPQSAQTASVINKSSVAMSQDELVVEYIIQEREIGEFKSVDCQNIVKRQFRNHPRANQDGATFGEYIAKNIWPLLEARGVRLVGDKPRRYLMTIEAKESITEA